MHFAISNAEVMMTTKLEGPPTRFLPFNKGNRGGAGNPPSPSGHATGYVWEEIWERGSWLEIIGRYVVAETVGTPTVMTPALETALKAVTKGITLKVAK